MIHGELPLLPLSKWQHVCQCLHHSQQPPLQSFLYLDHQRTHGRDPWRLIHHQHKQPRHQACHPTSPWPVYGSPCQSPYGTLSPSSGMDADQQLIPKCSECSQHW
ncbi:Os08g0136001 [Oryza sativa Japonica Group]|uniref:Os08g0136001 protein n=1 Tax=Oryza sativa subsp. japonica TaxID=39947 RepID=A0A0P0XBG6_ORYSJ|nr:hypothetical protein EE612_042003 [Oryza sativa]BAT03739.1 Os08g0136001 [Oryza sativa Japonica Group]